MEVGRKEDGADGDGVVPKSAVLCGCTSRHRYLGKIFTCVFGFCGSPGNHAGCSLRAGMRLLIWPRWGSGPEGSRLFFYFN